MKKYLVSILVVFYCMTFSDSASIINGDGNEKEDQVAQPYLWPNFPFFPGVNFPPSFPAWMTERRPTALPQLPEIRFPDIRFPWPFPPKDDDDDDDEDIEECPDDGIKFISYPDNCEKYILCVDGDELATLSCPPDFHFSRELRGCTTPEEAECE